MKDEVIILHNGINNGGFMLSGIINLLRSLIGSRNQSMSDGARKRLQKNFLNTNEDPKAPEYLIDRKMKSMEDSQGPDNFASETRNSNMNQRNF